MQDPLIEFTGAQFLTPANTKIFIGRLGSLHCVVNDQSAFANVYGLLCFPIFDPQHYIAIRYTDDNGKEQDIGIIEDLAVFPQAVQTLIKESLRRQYFEQIITQIQGVRWEYGLLFFDVGTADGNKTFLMKWQQDKAIEYGKNGKVLLDIFENRYIIPSVDDLPKADRERLMRFIYW